MYLNKNRSLALAFFMLTIFVNSVILQLSDDVKKLIRDMIEKCAKQENVQSSSLQESIKLLTQPPKTIEEACFHKCILKEHGVIKDGRYDWGLTRDQLDAFAAEYPEEIEQEDLEKMRQVIAYCEEKVTGTYENECELAKEVTDCSHNRGAELGLDLTFEEEDINALLE